MNKLNNNTVNYFSFKMFFLIAASFGSLCGFRDYSQQVPPPVIQPKIFFPRFLIEQGHLSLAQLDFKKPKISREFLLNGTLTKESVTYFFSDFAKTNNLLRDDIAHPVPQQCIKIIIPLIQTYAAQFIADITIAPMCARDGADRHWFLKAVSNNHIGEIKNLIFLDRNRRIFSRFTHDIEILIPENFFKYYKEPPERFISHPENMGVPTYELKFDSNYFYLIKAADGVSLEAIFASGDYQKLAVAIKEFAKAMAFLHQRFMLKQSIPTTFQVGSVLNYFRTITHGDAHWGNVFSTVHQKKLV